MENKDFYVECLVKAINKHRGKLEVKMSPTRYCEAIQCTDCNHYTECLEYQIKTNELKGKLLKEIKIIIKMED